MAPRPAVFCFLFSHILLFLYGFFGEIAAAASFRPKALVLPVVKDATTQQYVTTLQHETPLISDQFVVDLGSAFLWEDCDTQNVSTTFRQVPCGASACTAAGALSCTRECYLPHIPGCKPGNTCVGFPSNPIANSSSIGFLSDDVLVLRSTDGRSAGPAVFLPHFIFMCAPTGLVSDFAAGSRGMLGLGRSGVGAPIQLATAFGFRKKFAVCLPSSGSSPGVIFFGDGPYVLLPGVDVSTPIAYTELLINPVSTAQSHYNGQPSVEYFVKVNAIKVNGKVVPLNATLLDINNGNGGTKISTVDTHTKLESSVYRAVEAAFVREAAAMAIKRVAPVQPFSACFSTTNVASTHVGWAVPEIDLLLEGATTGWTIFGANSMVDVMKGVMCLGFLDGGVNSRTTIVIGGYQLENNLLQFDLQSSTMGFSSSLLFRQTTCSNFNFTSAPH